MPLPSNVGPFPGSSPSVCPTMIFKLARTCWLCGEDLEAGTPVASTQFTIPLAPGCLSRDGKQDACVTMSRISMFDNSQTDARIQVSFGALDNTLQNLVHKCPAAWPHLSSSFRHSTELSSGTKQGA